MKENNKRRSFLKKITIGSVCAALARTSLLEAKEEGPYSAHFFDLTNNYKKRRFYEQAG